MAIIKADSSNFQYVVLGSDKPVFVDFSATWCGPCKMYHPTFEEFANEHPECSCVEVDIDESPDVAAQFGIYAVPTTVVVKGGAPVGQMMGVVNKISLETKLNELL